MTLNISKTVPIHGRRWRDNLARWIANTAVRLIATHEYRKNLTATYTLGMTAWDSESVRKAMADHIALRRPGA